MLWLLVLLLLGGLSFVLFHKPPVNAMGAGWTPPPHRGPDLVDAADDAETLDRTDATAENAVTLRLVRARPLRAYAAGPTDQPHA